MYSLRSLFSTAAAALLCIDSAFAFPAPPSAVARAALSSLSVPLNGLPSPEGLTLKYVALGEGTQNYTCANTSTTPVAIGAVATLYDARSILTATPGSIPGLAALAYSIASSMSLPTLGHHWFSASAVPSFDLEAADPQAFLSAKKTVDVTAPNSSMPDSVDWLYLVDDGRGVSSNLKAVYRVETASGSAPAVCPHVGTLEVRYAAEYWFFD